MFKNSKTCVLCTYLCFERQHLRLNSKDKRVFDIYNVSKGFSKFCFEIKKCINNATILQYNISEFLFLTVFFCMRLTALIVLK